MQSDNGTAENISSVSLNTSKGGRMLLTPHVEHHFTGSEIVRDIVIGMSYGLTVPIVLAAGPSGVADSTVIVITGGLAEIAAGSIAMGLGGYKVISK
jgi:alanine dehydrogenase